MWRVIVGLTHVCLSVSEYLDTVHRGVSHGWVPDFSTDALTGQCRLPPMYQVDNSLLVPAPPRSHIKSPSLCQFGQRKYYSQAPSNPRSLGQLPNRALNIRAIEPDCLPD